MEKPAVIADEKSVTGSVNDGSDSSEVESSPNWRPGYGARFPWLAAGAIALVVLCTAASIAVLVGSNHVSSSIWIPELAPNVCLSGISAVSNIMLAFVVAEGIAISWWRKAMRGATVAQLHQSWTVSMNVGNIWGSMWPLDAVALAALATKLAVIDGILFQRATSTYTHQDPAHNIPLLGIAATEFPTTAYIVSNDTHGAHVSPQSFMIGDSYTPVVNTWAVSNGFYADYNDWFRTANRKVQHCDGTCFTTLQAIGFEIDCTGQQPIHEDIAEAPISAYEANGDESQWTNIPIFNSSFTLQYPDDSADFMSITLYLYYFQADDPYQPSDANCAGKIYNTTCTLRPALVTYPVKIMNFTNEHIINGVSLGSLSANTMADDMMPLTYDHSNKQAMGFTVGPYIQVNETHTVGGLSALGGLLSAFSQFLSSTATISYDPMPSSMVPWSLYQQGTLAQTMMYGPPNMGSCDCSFRHESLDTIIQGINDLTFLTALGMVDSMSFTGMRVHADQPATVVGVESNSTTSFRRLGPSTQVREVIYYKSNFSYMAAGVVATLVCVALVIPSFWRYGELGRDVTLGPIEIAGAFRAPMLAEGRAEACGNVNTLIREVGDRKVKYGFVNVEGGGGQNGNRVSVPQVGLAMATPEKVRPASGAWSAQRAQSWRSR